MYYLMTLAACMTSVTADPGGVATLCDLGVSPEVLAVAGHDGDDVPVLLTRLDSFADAEEALAGLRADVDAAQRSLRDTVTIARADGDPHAHATAAQRFAAQKTAYDTARAELKDDLLDGLPNGATLARVIHNQRREVPQEFWILDLSDRQWTDLETALAQRHNPYVDLTAQQESMLLLAETSADVQAARQRLETRLASIQSAFGEALTE